MIFKQLFEIERGLKVETRRVVKPGEKFIKTPYGTAVCTVADVNGVETSRRLKWRVGQDYAVVAKRGLPGVTIGGVPLRVRITGIRQERLHDIDRAGAIAEGLYHVSGWFTTSTLDEWFLNPRDGYRTLWESINKTKGTRWTDNPLVWVIRFERMQYESEE